MKIVRLMAENVKKIKVVEITPTGNLIPIKGNNGAGKSSILDSIWWAIHGRSNIQSKPIREGEERAEIQLDLGTLHVTRKFIKQDDGTFTTSIKVTQPDNSSFSSPQKMLDAMTDSLSFDPLEFSRMPPRDQISQLESLVPDFDFEENRKTRDNVFQERTLVNREIDRLRAKQADLETELQGQTKPEALDTSDLANKLAEAEKHNADLDAKKYRLHGKKTSLSELEKMETELIERISELTTELDSVRGQQTELKAEIEGIGVLGDRVDTLEISVALKKQAENRGIIERFETLKTTSADLEEATLAAKAHTDAIENLDDRKSTAIRRAKLPVEGISLGESGIELNGQPFDQASDAERLRASVAIAIARAPKLRVIRIRDGSLLDDEGMKILGEVANNQDFQIWIERVGNTDDGGVLIEDGQLA